MKLTNLNCPQCNGNLSQQGDSFFCTSCGSAFTIDYDENDVKYTDLVTQADRTRQLIARDQELLQTRHRLKEQMEQNKLHRDFEREKKNDIRKIASIVASYYISIFLFLGGLIGLIVYFSHSVKASKKEMKVKAQEIMSEMTQALNSDRSVVENAALEGQDYLFSERSTIFYDPAYVNSREAKIKDTPKPYDAYVMIDSSAKSKLCIFFESVYEYQDTKEEFTIYDCVIIPRFSLNEMTKMIETDYVCSMGNRTNGTFGGYREADQLYLECIEGEYESTSFKIDQVFEDGKGGENG
ncbi:MAG: hypothetical protein IKD90_07770 [Clostridiales bacterium]|nr:hypothetical protein [Clostridiales bacterium]